MKKSRNSTGCIAEPGYCRPVINPLHGILTDGRITVIPRNICEHAGIRNLPDRRWAHPRVAVLPFWADEVNQSHVLYPVLEAYITEHR